MSSLSLNNNGSRSIFRKSELQAATDGQYILYVQAEETVVRYVYVMWEFKLRQTTEIMTTPVDPSKANRQGEKDEHGGVQLFQKSVKE